MCVRFLLLYQELETLAHRRKVCVCAVEVPVPDDSWALLLRDCCKAAHCGSSAWQSKLLPVPREWERGTEKTQALQSVLCGYSVTQRLPLEVNFTSTLAYSTDHLTHHPMCHPEFVCAHTNSYALLLFYSKETQCVWYEAIKQLARVWTAMSAHSWTLPWSFCLPGTESNHEPKSTVPS